MMRSEYLNHVKFIQILPNQEEYLRCLFTDSSDINAFSKYCKNLKLSNVASFHFSFHDRDKGIMKYFSFCTGKELIVLFNPNFDQI